MTIITNRELNGLVNNDSEDGVFLDPILETNQIGAVSIDIRLGYDFLVSVNTRVPYISLNDRKVKRSISSYFQNTRRDVGDSFLLYPGQLVLTTSLEYIRLPSNIYAEVITRSSYNRLGVRLSTMLQPGFRGCIPLEVVNDNNNSIELIVGSRMFQIKLYKVDENLQYGGADQRKYYGNVNPSPSKANEDNELDRLIKLSRYS